VSVDLGSEHAAYLLKRLFGFAHGSAMPIEQRRREVVYLSLVGIATALIFSVANINYYGFPALGYVQLFVVFAILCPVLWLARHDGLVLLSENLLMIAAVLIFGSLLVFGGIEGTGIYWVYIFPFVAFFITDQRRGWYWTAAFFVVNYAIYNSCENGLFACVYSAMQFSQHLQALLFFSVTAAAANSSRNTFEHDLQTLVAERTSTAEKYLDRLQYLVLHDELTGLPNRTMLNEIIKAEILKLGNGSYKLVAAYLKIERLFEMVNILGEREGDMLIKQIAERLDGIVGTRGKIARTARDEFVVLLTMPAQLDELSIVSEYLEHDGTLDFNGAPLLFHYTTGICAYPAHAANGVQLLRNAEQALMQAQQEKVNIVRYDSAQDEVFVRHHMLYGKLQAAINQHYLLLYYQPQVDMASGRVIGVEALARWQDPQQGFIDPSDFIPVAEQSGLIIPFANWMINTGIKQCAQWHKENLKLSVSLNMSAYNLADPNLIKTLTDNLESSGLDAKWVILEITESSFMHQPEATLAKIYQLHKLGFRISVDDFGTGYSSLTYLKNLPVYEVKIDQTFVKNMLANPRDEAIVQSTIALAHNLGAKVVAEGIEDLATALSVKTLGCDIGQGFFYSEPGPADSLHDALLHAYSSTAV
jgi:diguanylate cyclase (GGDEF)-like protein